MVSPAGWAGCEEATGGRFEPVTGDMVDPYTGPLSTWPGTVPVGAGSTPRGAVVSPGKG
jgi:hypothetical protein